MARIFIDGFENKSYDLWTNFGGGTFTAPSTLNVGLKGDWCLGLDSVQSLTKTFDTPLAELYIACKIYKTANNNGNLIWFRDSGGTVIASITISATNKVELRLGDSSGSLLATGTYDWLDSDNLHLIEIRYKPLNVGGVFTIKFDGIQEVTYSGDTTNGLEGVNSVCIGFQTGGKNGVSMYLDDVVMDNANWIGNTYIQKGQVSGAGTTTNFTPSAGANYQCIDEIPASDADYNSSNTTGHIDTFPIAVMTGGVGTIKAVQLEARIAYEGTPVPTHIQLGVRSGGTDYFATDFSPALSFGKISKILELDPDGSKAWTESSVNAMEIGYKVTV